MNLANYYKKIDGLRCVAITLVLIEHIGIKSLNPISFGYYGVDLFFVISGFLITEILIRPNSLSFGANYKNFIGRRTLRIFPIYYGTIAVLLLLNLSAVKDHLWYLLTYTYNYALIFDKTTISPISHFWSLCVEEQFYVFWPLVVLLLKSKLKTLALITLLFICFGYGQMLFNFIPSISPYNYVGLPTRMASLAMGALGTLVIALFGVPKSILDNKVLEIAVLVLLVFMLWADTEWKVLIFGMCSLYLVLKASYSEFCISSIERFLKNNMVVSIGVVSYGIYIFHKPIAYFSTLYVFDPLWNLIEFENLGLLSKLKWHSWIIKIPLYLIIIYSWSIFSYRFVEQPFLRLKNKYFNYNV